MYYLKFFLLFFLDLKVEWNEKDLENINIPIDIYEKACVIDAKEGVEVRLHFHCCYLKNRIFFFFKLLDC